MLKKVLLFLVVVILAAGAGYAYFHVPRPTAGASTDSSKTEPTSVATHRTITFVVNAAGEIGPADQVSVRPEINGRIDVLAADVGDKVKKDALLFSLDARDLNTERDSKLAQIDGAKLQVEKARRLFDRASKLYKDNLISQEEYDNVRIDFELSQNNLERTGKDLAIIEEKLRKTRILAPFDCTVLLRPVSIGQAVSGAGGFNSGTEVMNIANLSDMIIVSHVNQADVTRVKKGMNVNVVVEAVPGLCLTGIVERIAPQASLKNGLKGFSTQIRLNNLDPRVRPGMTANLTIPILSAEDVLALPLSAVFSDQGSRFVFVKREDGFEMVPIEVGISDFQFVEVLSGLKDGDEVAMVRPVSMLPSKSPKGTNDVPGKVAAQSPPRDRGHSH
jgi:RND family efflux transporter MFP subunit